MSEPTKEALAGSDPDVQAVYSYLRHHLSEDDPLVQAWHRVTLNLPKLLAVVEAARREHNCDEEYDGGMLTGMCEVCDALAALDAAKDSR